MNRIEWNLPVSGAVDLADRIEADGYAVVEGIVPPAELKLAQDFVRQTVLANGGQYVHLEGSHNLGGTFLERLPADGEFIKICHDIYSRITGDPPPDTKFYQILRCLSGSEVKRHSMKFHYDSYVITALFPIAMPSHGSKGNLIIFPGTRSIRRLYATNLLDKIIVDNRLSQWVLNILYKRRSKGMISLELKPGNLYLFWGYRSLHTNEPCEENEIRSTALLHYADPHFDSRLKRMLRRPG